MAITYIGSAGSGSLSCTIQSSSLVGDLAIAVVANESQGGSQTSSIFTGPSGWTFLTGYSNPGGYSDRMEIWFKVLVSGDPGTNVTWSGGNPGGACSTTITVFRGASASVGYTSFASNINVNYATAPTFTPSSAGLALACFSSITSNPAAWTVPSGYTQGVNLVGTYSTSALFYKSTSGGVQVAEATPSSGSSATNNVHTGIHIVLSNANSQPTASITSHANNAKIDPRVNTNITWTYSDADADEQMDYQLEYSVSGANTWTDAGGGGAYLFHNIPAGTFADETLYDIRLRVHDGFQWGSYTTVTLNSDSWTYGPQITSSTQSGEFPSVFSGNSSFETDTSGWESNGAFGAYMSATLARSNIRATVGSYSLEVTCPAPGGSINTWANTNVSVEAGKTYIFEVDVFVPTGGPDVAFDVVFKGTGPDYTTKNQWFTITHEYYSSETGGVFPGVMARNISAGQKYYIDNFRMYEKAQLGVTYEIGVRTSDSVAFGPWSTPVEFDTITPISGTDSAAISLSESASPAGSFSSTDTGSIAAADTSSSFRTISAVDTLTLQLAESNLRWNNLPGVEPPIIILSEGRTLAKSSSRTDTQGLAVSETSALLSFVGKTATDQGSVAISDVSAKQVFSIASSSELCYISLQEVNTLLKIDKEVEPVSGATAVELRKKPVGLWPLATNLDYSGYGRDAVFTGTPGTHLPLVAGVSNSTVFDNVNRGKFPTTVFQKGYESRPFTIEANFRPVNVDGTTAEQQILGNTGQMDGIVIDGTVVKFKMNYTGGTVAVSHDLQILRAIRASAVHTVEKNSLYIDGELVAEVDIPEEYRDDEFVFSDGFLYSGASTTTDKIAVGGVSIYSTALSLDEVSENYYAVNNISEPEDFTGMYGGNRILLSSDRMNRFLNRVWETQSDWTSGSFMQNAAVLSDEVLPESESGLTMAGAWYNSFELDAANDTSIYAVNMEWDGSGVAIEVSLDGVSWTAVQRGVNISLIPQGFNPTETILHIRALFTQGLPEGEAVLRRLEVNGYSDGEQTVHNITVSLDNASPRKDRLPVEFRDDWGVTLNTGSITLTPLASTEPPVKTIEVWSKSNSVLTTTLTPTATYTNAEAAPFTSDEWQVRHYVVSGGQTTPFTISGTGQIGQIVLYDKALTQTEATEIVESYFFPPTSVVMDNNSVVVNSVDEGATIYAYDWSIEGAG